MKNSGRNYFFTFLQFSFLLMFFFSCKKQNNLGLPDNPEPAFSAKYITGLPAKAITVKHDIVQTDGVATSLLGSYYDPYFGKVKAGFATQFFLPGANVTFAESLTLDSLVLSLAYTDDPNSYGIQDKFKGMLHVKVFELTKDLSTHEAYYSDKDMSSYYDAANPVADIYTFPETKSAVYINGQNQAPQLRIRLSNSLGNKLLKAPSSAYVDNTSFNTFFKGLILTVENDFQKTGEGSIVYISPYNSYTKLALWYNNSGTHGSYDFLIRDLVSARVNLFEHDYTATEIAPQLNGTNTDTSLIYIQSMAGVRSLIKLPFLESFMKDSGRIAINRCEIVFKPDLATVTAEYPLFDQMYLFGVSEKSDSLIYIDDFTDGIKYGGVYDVAKQEYRFNVTRYVQQVISGSYEDRGLYLQGSGSAIKANRVIIKGNENILINLTYTKF